jgi:UDP-glucose 4-epimerase/UDP-glucuronate decarboxylase
MKPRVLITGGAGFIGFHLASGLSQSADCEVVLVDNFRRGRRDEEFEALLHRPGVSLVEGDLAEGGVLERVGGAFDEVYHLAAVIGVRNVLERPHEVVRINALATLHLLDWFVAGGGRKLLFASTSEAYAWTQLFYPLPVPTPESVPLALMDLSNPRSSYAGSKIFGELAVNHYCRAYKKPFVIVRFHNVYGPRMGYDHVIPELHERARQGQDPLVVFSADHRRAFCYVQDAVDLLIKMMRGPAADGLTLNVGNDQEEVTMRQLAERILHLMELERTILVQPAPNDPIARRCPDMTRARKLLGYAPRFDLYEGLGQTLAWYDQHPRPAAVAL